MGAWIEIVIGGAAAVVHKVAPLVGAWIEICLLEPRFPVLSSLPLWERGLKYLGNKVIQTQDFVAPLVGAWIEISTSGLMSLMSSRRSPCGSVD